MGALTLPLPDPLPGPLPTRSVPWEGAWDIPLLLLVSQPQHSSLGGRVCV